MEIFRVQFKDKNQKEFFNEVKKRLNCSFVELSRKNHVPKQTLRNYISGRCLMPSPLFEKLCLDAHICKEVFVVSYLSNNWGCVDAGRKGMGILLAKYSHKFKIWRSNGAKKGIAGKNIKVINYPELNEELAEFIGIYLGDGTITKHVVRISGDSRYDLGYFLYISALVKRLFNLDSKISHEKRNSLLITVYSRNLCSFLKDKYGINFGDKIRNQTCIPAEILNDKKLALACLRGLVDTDGCISRRGRNGSQFCVQFFNGNKALLQQVREIGFKYGFFSYFTGGETGTNKWGNVEKYFREVGSSNLKHIVRFLVRLNEGKTLYLREVLQYYPLKMYQEMVFPFKLNSPARN